MARARHSRKTLLAEGILVLGHQGHEPKIAAKLGIPIPRKGEMISTRVPDWLGESAG